MIGSVLNGIKINGAIAATRSSDGTIYTAPAGGGAIINLHAAAGTGGFNVTIGGSLAYRFSDTATTASPQSGFANNFVGNITVYVGPSQVVAVASYSGTKVLHISGIEFTNGV